MHLEGEVDVDLFKLGEDGAETPGKILESPMLEPVKPLTTAGTSLPPFRRGWSAKKLCAAFAVRIIFSAARRRTPSGSPSPHTSGDRVA
jgi:hypothetical protein